MKRAQWYSDHGSPWQLINKTHGSAPMRHAIAMARHMRLQSPTRAVSWKLAVPWKCHERRRSLVLPWHCPWKKQIPDTLLCFRRFFSNPDRCSHSDKKKNESCFPYSSFPLLFFSRKQEENEEQEVTFPFSENRKFKQRVKNSGMLR